MHIPFETVLCIMIIYFIINFYIVWEVSSREGFKVQQVSTQAIVVFVCIYFGIFAVSIVIGAMLYKSHKEKIIRT